MNHTLKLTSPVAAGPILDIRLAMEDAGLWCINRVKDANGWRDANAWENACCGIHSPVTGYIQDKQNGRYTPSGKFELTYEVAPHTVAPTKSHGQDIWLETTYHNTRHEARAAALALLNEQQQEPEVYEQRHFEYCPDYFSASIGAFNGEIGAYLTQYGKYEIVDRSGGHCAGFVDLLVMRGDCDGIDIGTASSWDAALWIVNEDAARDRRDWAPGADTE